MKEKSLDKKKLRNSFKYAINGIKIAITKEQNMNIHFVITVLVLICAVIFKLTLMEWMLCLVMIALVIATELINTSIETMCDLITKEKHEDIKIIKDTAAGAVLVFATSAAIIGLMIFIPKLLEVVK